MFMVVDVLVIRVVVQLNELGSLFGINMESFFLQEKFKIYRIYRIRTESAASAKTHPFTRTCRRLAAIDRQSTAVLTHMYCIDPTAY